MGKSLSSAALAVAGLIWASCTWFGSAIAASFTSFDVPGATHTFPDGINPQGDIAGFYFDQNFVLRGFIRYADGTFTTFAAPDATDTYVVGIDVRGDVLIQAATNGAPSRGFLRKADGNFVEISVPGADLGTFPTALTRRGISTGIYATSPGVQHSWVRSRNGVITQFDAPDASYTNSVAVSDYGVTGDYLPLDGPSTSHGFVRTANGILTTFDAPGAIITYPQAISASGETGGFYYDTNYQIHGFTRTADGISTTFDALPGQQLTTVVAFAGRALAAGYSYDSGYHITSFLRLSNGRIVNFQVPGAGEGDSQGTQVTAMMDRHQLVGIYSNSDMIAHGWFGYP